MRSRGLVILCDNVEAAFKDFVSHFVMIEASGGVLFNDEGEVLLIKRLGKWDLPKGKMDAGESTAEAALREVTEECGLDELTLGKELPATYHTYKMHNHRFLKITWWFAMTTTSKIKPVPQTEENITEAKWYNWHHLDTAELDTYRSIRDLLNNVRSILG